MSNQLQERIAQAVEGGRRARQQYYSAIQLPDEQRLGAPASELGLTALESCLKRKLPPSYRAFLKLYDGWRMALGAVDLLSVQEMLDGPRAAEILRWKQKATASGDRVAAGGLVIGFGDATPIKLLLDPKTIDDLGEWAVVGYDLDEQWTCSSFLVWLEKSLQDFTELALEEETGSNPEAE